MLALFAHFFVCNFKSNSFDCFRSLCRCTYARRRGSFFGSFLCVREAGRPRSMQAGVSYGFWCFRNSLPQTILCCAPRSHFFTRAPAFHEHWMIWNINRITFLCLLMIYLTNLFLLHLTGKFSGRSRKMKNQQSRDEMMKCSLQAHAKLDFRVGVLRAKRDFNSSSNWATSRKGARVKGEPQNCSVVRAT